MGPQSPLTLRERCQGVREQGICRISRKGSKPLTLRYRGGEASILQSAGQLAQWFIKAQTIASLDLLPPSTKWALNLAEQGFWGFLHFVAVLLCTGDFHACPLLPKLLQENVFLLELFN